MRQGHNYEHAAHGIERGVAAINGREGKRDRRDGEEPTRESWVE